MFNWIASSKGVITTSFMGLLAFTAYSFLVSRYVLEDLAPGIVLAGIETIIVLTITGFWVWGLISITKGNSSGLVILLICNILPALFTIYDIIFYSPVEAGWPLLQSVIYITFSICALNVIILSLRLSR